MSLVFVGGSQRSGTTLLQTLLCQDAETNPLIHEARYLRHLVTAYRFGRTQFKAGTRDYFRDQESYVAFNRKIIQGFLRNTRALFPGTRHLVLREPHLTMLFPELAELLPKAKFVCVIRDPRDVIASMVNVGKKLTADGTAGDAMARMFIGRNMGELSRHFLSFYEPVFRNRDPGFRGRMQLLRYEDLVREPEEVFAKIRKQTGLKLLQVDPHRDPDLGKVSHDGRSAYQRAWKTDKDGKGISDDRIGGYADVLDRKEIGAVESHCRNVMTRFKYAPVSAGAE